MTTNPNLTVPAVPAGAEANRRAAACIFARGIAVTAMLTGGLVLIGWALEVVALTSIGPGLVPMKGNTALGFILAGAGLWAAQPEAGNRTLRRVALVCALALVLLGLLTLFEYALGWDSGLGRLLIYDGSNAKVAAEPEPMAPSLALGFLLFGLALLLDRPGDWKLGQSLSLAVNVIGVLTLLGYLYPLAPPQLIPQFAAMAPHSAALLALLGAGLLATQPGHGLLGLLVSSTPGGKTARRLLPVALFLPPLLGWLSLECETRGWFHAEVGVALVVLSCSLILGAVVWQVSESLQFSDRERQKAERRIQRLNRTYAVLSNINQLIVRERRPHVLFIEACRIAVEKGEFSLAWVGLTDAPAGAMRLAAHAGVAPDARETVEAILSNGAGPIFFTVQQSGRLLICNDTAQNHPAESWRELCRARGYRALASLPLKVDGRVLGTFTICAAEVGFFDTDEMRLLEELAADISFAMEVSGLESERQMAASSLQEEQALYAALADATTDHIYFKDRACRFIRINAQMARYLGLLDPARAMGKTDGDFFDAEHARKSGEDEQRILTTGEPMIAAEEKVTGYDGRVAWISTTKVALRDERGRVYGLVGISRDITEHKLMQEQSYRAQRLEAIGALAGGVAHDLNNILAPMLILAGLLNDKLGDPDDRKILALVENAAKRGADIIRQLLAFSRGIEGARVSVQPRHLLTEVAHLMQETFPRNITLVKNAPSDLWCILADATQVHQVLLNLCVNARDAMPSGGRLTLEASNTHLNGSGLLPYPLAAPGRYVVLSVADTGHGIPPEVISRIFEPFFTTKEIGKGTGLGLSTVLGIAKGHGGFVTVDTERGRGTVFKVYLPATGDSVSSATSNPTPPDPVGHRELILVVDDEESIRETTRQLLERNNYRVLTARNGKEALGMFIQQNGAVRLVLTDIMMPEMGGVELIRALRALEPGLRVAAFSGLDKEDRKCDLAAFGITEVLLKPFEAQMLRKTVERMLSVTS